MKIRDEVHSTNRKVITRAVVQNGAHVGDEALESGALAVPVRAVVRSAAEVGQVRGPRHHVVVVSHGLGVHGLEGEHNVVRANTSESSNNNKQAEKHESHRAK